MNFRFQIFAEHKGFFFPMYKVKRTGTGLFIHSSWDNEDDHFSYHNEGHSHHINHLNQHIPEMVAHKQRPPLDEFSGQDSILQHNIIFGELSTRKARSPVDSDLVVKAENFSGIEIILSDKYIELPLSSARKTLDVKVSHDTFPIIIAESFRLSNDKKLTLLRFTPSYPIMFGDELMNKQARF